MSKKNHINFCCLLLILVASTSVIAQEKPEVRCYVEEIKQETLASVFKIKCTDGDESWEWEDLPLSKAPGGMKLHDPISFSLVAGNTENAGDINCLVDVAGSESMNLRCPYPQSKTKRKHFSVNAVPAWLFPPDVFKTKYAIQVVLAADELKRGRVEKLIAMRTWKAADQAKRKAEFVRRKAAGEKAEDSDEEEYEEEEPDKVEEF